MRLWCWNEFAIYTSNSFGIIFGILRWIYHIWDVTLNIGKNTNLQWVNYLTRGVRELWITDFNKFFFCSIVLYQESIWAEEFVSNAQPFSRKIDSKFIKLFIYSFVRTFLEKSVVAQGLKCLTTTQETRFGSRWFPFFM